VRKTHTARPGAFCSPNGGPIGVLAEGRPVRLLGLSRLPVYPPPASQPWPRVPLIAVGLDDGGEVVRALEGRCEGAVLLGLGGGHVPPALLLALSDLAGVAPVVLAARVLAGSVLASTYGYPGSERDLLARGLIGAGFLDAYKARVLLRLLLALGAGRPEITAAFAEAGDSNTSGRTPSGDRP
jgi:L-asparaginase